MHVYTGISIHKYISLFSHLREPRSNDIPVARSTPSAQILVSNTTLQEKEPGLLREIWPYNMVLELGQERRKIVLEQLVVPES